MSYESRVFVMERRKIKTPVGIEYVSGMPVASFDMCGMPVASFDMCVMEPSFKELFDIPVDFDIRGDNDADLTEDKYGDKVKYTHLAPVIDYLEKEVSKSEPYRRLRPFLSFLKSLSENDREEWDEIVLVHYGY